MSYASPTGSLPQTARARHRPRLRASAADRGRLLLRLLRAPHPKAVGQERLHRSHCSTFGGLENDRRFGPTYRARKAEKQAVYAKHGLRLIELTDAEIEKLDDVLPRMLLRFGIESV
jgi:hypothetical protein